MRTILLVAGTAGLIGILAACGGDDRPQAIGNGAASTGGKGGSKPKPEPSEGGDNMGGAGNEVDPLAPLVKVLAPEAAEAPDDGVLSTSVVNAVCKVEQSSENGSAPVDPTTVRITLIDLEGNETEQKASSSANENEFESEFTLTTVPAGRVSFRCAAQDTDHRDGSDQVETFVDHGPTITPVSPLPDQAYAVKGGLAVEFRIEPTPLTEDDVGAAVGAVAFEFDGKEYELDEDPPGTFRAALPIDNTEKFPQVPGGSVVVRATNQRSPEPVRATLAYSVKIDGTGPTITITSPKPQAVVGGKVTVEMTIRDEEAGVDPKSVSITRYNSDQPQPFNPETNWTQTGDKYTYTFDSKQVEQFEKVQTTINVRARDKVGNQSASGQSIQLYLDNVAPQVDLDPADIRIHNGLHCSRAVDPVGESSLNDLAGQFGEDPQGVIGFFRAFVREKTNIETGQEILFYSGTDPTQTRLYAQPAPADADTPLLVNKNPLSDSTCDDIGNIEDMVASPNFTALKPLPDNMGAPWFGSDDGLQPTIAGCTFGTQVSSPSMLCQGDSDMYYVPYFREIKDPMVYVVGTPNSSDATCTGIDWSFLSKDQPDGWVCLAARVVDKAGNVGISPPLRICVDNPDNDIVPPCRTMSIEPPTCTDGCTPPARGGGDLFAP
jgi:hypothetical protein